MVVFVITLPHLSPLNLRLGEGDLNVLLGRECAALGLSGSFRKLFCRVRGTGELDRTLFFGIDPITFRCSDCFSNSMIVFASKSDFWKCALVAACERAFSLIELIRIICGFSFTHDHKNSLENDLSLELKAELAVDKDEVELVVLPVVHVREEMEEVELVGEGGEGEILFE